MGGTQTAHRRRMGSMASAGSAIVPFRTEILGETQPHANTLINPRFRPGSLPVVACALGYFALYLLWQVTRLGGADHGVLIGDAFFVPIDLLAIYSMITAARNCRADRRRSWSWLFMSFAMVGYLISNVAQFYFEGIRHLPDSPYWSDAIFYVFCFAGLIGFAAKRPNMITRWLLTLETLTIALGAGAVLWYVVAGPLVTGEGHSIHQVVYAILYPLGDLILLLTAVRILQRGVPSSSERAIRMIALSICAYVLADTFQAYRSLHDGYHGGDLVDITAMAAALFFVLSGTLQLKVEGPESNSSSKRTGSAGISYVSLVALFALTFLDQRHARFFPDLSILTAAVLAGFLVIIGQHLLRKLLIGEQAMNHDLLGELRHQAFHDGMTGLVNRALFSERLEHALERRNQPNLNHAVLMIDLNGFKTVNDSLGHEAGDEVLRTVALRLSAGVRRGDTVARIGGDEFAILFEDVPGRDATLQLVEQLLELIRQPIIVANRRLVTEASIGIALTSEEPLSAEELLRFADTAMYQAKQQRSSHYCVFESAMQTALAERAELEADLVGAVGRGELRVLYQPIVNLATQRTIGFEALVRWMHPTRGLLPPMTFLPLAEQGGLIHEIDTWVLWQACTEARRWQRQSPQFAGICVHVNLSPLQLREPDLVATITEALAVTGLEPRYLTLELLESSVVDDLELARERLNQLKALGLRIAVDDFGTGYSSLSHLRTLPIDELKIDRSFIAAMESSTQANVLVHSLIQLGAALGIDTVAEGIEETNQLAHLQDEECIHGQGFLFARPLTPDAIRPYLLKSLGPLGGSAVEPVGSPEFIG
jgi:diguanylate cyclase (GGDEF)-like protein